MHVGVGVPVVLELDDGELPSDLYWVEGEDLRPILRRVLNVDLNRRRRPIKVELNRKVNIVCVAKGEKKGKGRIVSPFDFFCQEV